MAKMDGFKVYKGTKQSFIESGKAAANANSIVYITGGNDAKGSCIYAQGVYFANFAEMIAAINYVKGVYVNGNMYNATAGGGYITFEASDPSTISLNVEHGRISIALTDTFVNTVGNTALNLGSKTDTANSDGSAFARIANLTKLVSDLTGGSVDSIEGQITKAIDALRTEIVGTLDADDSATMQAINDELDNLAGNISTIENDYATKQYVYDAVDRFQEEIFSDVANQVEENTGAISILNGNDSQDGSVDKKIKDAINDFATKVTDNSTIDTFKELVDYVSGVDGSATLASAIAQINTNKGAIETLNGNSSTVGSVDKKVKDAIDAEVLRANSAYATKAQGELADSAYQKPTDGIPLSDLSQGVKTSLTKADNAAPQSTTYTKTEVDNNLKNFYTKEETYSKAEVDAMWEWIEL